MANAHPSSLHNVEDSLPNLQPVKENGKEYDPKVALLLIMKGSLHLKTPILNHEKLKLMKRVTSSFKKFTLLLNSLLLNSV